MASTVAVSPSTSSNRLRWDVYKNHRFPDTPPDTPKCDIQHADVEFFAFPSYVDVLDRPRLLERSHGTIDRLDEYGTPSANSIHQTPWNVGARCSICNPHHIDLSSNQPILSSCKNASLHRRIFQICNRMMTDLRYSSRRRPHVLIVGLGSTGNLSGSPGMILATHLLSNYNVFVEFLDPCVEQDKVSTIPKMEEEGWNAENARQFNGVIVVDHGGVDMVVLRVAQEAGIRVEWLCNEWQTSRIE